MIRWVRAAIGSSMALRFILAALGLGLVGALIAYSVDEDLSDAPFGAAIGVALVVWAGVSVLREEIAKGTESSRALKRSLVMWGLGALVLVVAVIGGMIALEARHDEAGMLWLDSQAALDPIQSLKGIRVGEPFADVKTRVGGFELDAPIAGSMESSEKSQYVHRASRVRVMVEQERVLHVAYGCAKGDETRVNRIACDARESRVVHVFGNGARRLCADSARAGAQAEYYARSSAFDILDTGTRYLMVDGRVAGFVIMDPSALDATMGPGHLWRRCG